MLVTDIGEKLAEEYRDLKKSKYINGGKEVAKTPDGRDIHIQLEGNGNKTKIKIIDHGKQSHSLKIQDYNVMQAIEKFFLKFSKDNKKYSNAANLRKVLKSRINYKGKTELDDALMIYKHSDKHPAQVLTITDQGEDTRLEYMYKQSSYDIKATEFNLSTNEQFSKSFQDLIIDGAHIKKDFPYVKGWD